MENPDSAYLCCPACKGELSYVYGNADLTDKIIEIYCTGCKSRFSNEEEYIDFLGEKAVFLSTSRERFIRSVYTSIYTPATNAMFLLCGGATKAREEVMGHLRLKTGSVVLETGMGPGENFLWMSKHAENLTFFGIDIQKEMMKKCIKNLGKWKMKASLFRADAEALPFKNEMFDVVFHLGAINLFTDKKEAIFEMIRVAKPGTHIVIADETEKAGKLFNIFTGSKEVIVPPINLIPLDMLEINLKIIWRGYGYLIEFTKP